IETYNTAMAGEKIIYFHYDYFVEDKNNSALDHWEITPGIAYGITDKLMIDAHTHYAKFRDGSVADDRQGSYGEDGPSPFFEALAISVLYRITDDGPWHAAASAVAEFPFSRSKEVLGSEDNVYGGAFIFGRNFGQHSMVVANIGYEKEGDEDEWFWALGIKAPLGADPHGIAGGIEVLGDFDGTRWSVLPGVYAPLGESIQLKVGFEIGQQKDDNDSWVGTTRFSTAVMYRF
ncbi:MAG TPA: hypothetical protein PJ991_08105, partial [Kiritimatiellia bacterium]|nr:hypothetical protein [Kiritimatiellia bacterium]